MRNLLIGSRALDFWFGAGKCTKSNSDWDVISETPIEGTEWHDPNLVGNYQMERYAFDEETVNFNGHELHVVVPVGLAIIKRSHLWRALGFGKHITQYHRHLAFHANFFNASDKEILQNRTKLSYEKFPQQGPNLRLPVGEFFDDAVFKKYSHDWLHELYAYEDRPIYTKMQRDTSTAWCEKDMWDELSNTQQLQAVAEEAYVIATERFLVPGDFSMAPKLAYMKSIEKICTTLCKGWFRDFAIDNYPSAVGLFDIEKVNKVKAILQSTSEGK